MTHPKYKIPAHTTDMVCSADERFVYCLAGRRVVVLDLDTGQKTKVLHRLDDSPMTVSPDGRYFACDHPSESTKSLEVCVYDIADDHRERFRTRIRGKYARDAPHFTHDGKTILLKTGFPGRIWAVDISTGNCRCLYEVPPDYPVVNIDCSEEGILISVSGGKVIAPTGYVMFYKTIDDPPKMIRFDSPDAQCSSRHRQYLDELSFPYLCFKAWWLSDHRFLVSYDGREGTVFQVADVRKDIILVSETECRYRFPFTIYNMDFSADRKFATTLWLHQSVFVFRPDSGEIVWREQRNKPEEHLFNCHISSHCKYLLLLGYLKSDIVPLAR